VAFLVEVVGVTADPYSGFGVRDVAILLTMVLFVGVVIDALGVCLFLLVVASTVAATYRLLRYCWTLDCPGRADWR